MGPSIERYEAGERGPGGSGVPLLRSGRGGPTQVVSGSGRFVGARQTRSFHKDTKDEEGVILNLANMPIAQAAKVVLGDILGVDYVVDPKLDGKVTVHTAQPVRKSAAVELFQSALSVSGAALVDSGGLYKIVPQDQAATSGVSISSGSADQAPSSQRIGDNGRIVQLRYVSASEMQRVLEPISQRGGVVRADGPRNTLTLSGTAQEIATLQDTIAMFDIDTMRGMSFALVPVESANPDSLVEDLRKVFGSEKEGPMKGMIRFIGNKHLSTVLVISSQAQYLSRARAWIERLDARAAGNEKQFYSYRVQNRPAKELLRVLAALFGSGGAGGGNNVSPRFGQSSQSSGGQPDGGGSGGGSGGGAPTAPLGALNASGPTGGAGSGGGLGSSGGLSSGGGGDSGSGGGGDSGSGGGGDSGSSGGVDSGSGGGAGSGGFGSGGGAGSGSGGGFGSGSGGTQDIAFQDSRFKLAVDEAKNALVVMATPDDYKRLLRVVETLDVIPNQVFIEATIAEVSLTDQMQFGVRWFLQQNRSLTGFSDAGVATGGPSAAPTPLGGIPRSGGTPAGFSTNPYDYGGGLPRNTVAGGNLLGAAVGALFPGFAYSLLAPSTQVTLNALNSVTNVNVISTPSLTVLDNRQAVLKVVDNVPFQGSSTVGFGQVTQSVQRRDVGVILKITPHVNESGKVLLELVQEVSNVAGAAGTANPTFQKREVTTQVVVNDNEALMLGGLIQDQRDRDADQVPVLGDLPLIGNVFKDKSDRISKKELLIMITPHVLRSVSDARDITDEFKRKLLQIASKAKVRPHDIEQSTRRVLLDEGSTSGWRTDRSWR